MAATAGSLSSPTFADTAIGILDQSSTPATPTAPTSPEKETPHTVPSEGGVRAWLAIVGSFLIHSFVFGPTEYIFGIFEHHYQVIYPNAEASSIALIGTTGSAVTYLAGFLAGIVADRFGFRITALAGTGIMTLSLILASFTTQLWQLYLTQGVIFGVGASLAYYPAIAVPSHYFQKRRGLATGLAVSGVGAGGFVLAPLTNTFIDKTGIYWTFRFLAAFCLVVCGGASLLIAENKDRLKMIQPELQEKSQEDILDESERGPEKRPSFFAAVKIFKEPRFLSLSLAELAASIGVLIPLYYMQTYAVFIGLSAQQGALILGISNGASFAGRILLGLSSDYISNAKVLLLCSWFTAFAVLILWTVAHNFGVLLVMGLMFGFFAGGYISLVPVAIAQSFGTKEIASIIGMMYAAGGIGMLGGAPLAGFLLDVTRPNVSYLPVTLTAGGTLTVGAICISIWAYLNWKANRLRRVETTDTLS
ncbi:major facilitator superfamily domain-containing protein [Mortierella sp. GBAus27b]|nr:hypothetical protein BGX31_008540 [Mortierella sp. GBA43]KAI8357389.1 major facilitator superfamily domain-containing protein [Mortierella sp. GBAus27b]